MSLEQPTPKEAHIPILVAEDSEDNRFLLQAYCRGTDYDPTFAEDGKQAVVAYETGSFEIVIMDVQMPVMDGLLATRMIRGLETDQGRRRTPILALTASVLPHNTAEAHAAGCDVHLAKPISRKRFLNALEQWKPARRANELPVRIEIEPGNEQLALSYLIARERELPLFQDLLERAAFDELRRLAHNLVGTGTSYGFHEITRLGAAIARAGLGRDTEDLSCQIHALGVYIEAASRQLRTQS